MAAIPQALMAALAQQEGAQPEDPRLMAGPGVNPYDALIAAKRKAIETAPAAMYTPEQITQRRNENERQYQLGLLGQLSGDESLSGVGGSLLKQALAARQQRVTERGVADPLTGQFSYSPDYLRERGQTELEGLEGKSAAFVAARQKQMEDREERARRDADRFENQRILKGIGAAASKAAGAGGIDAGLGRVYQIEDRMADDFRNETKGASLVSGQFKNLAAIAQRKDAASDIAFVYSYMKMLDPTSVVREGEFATAEKSGGVPDRIRNLYNKTLNGEFLTPEQRADMLNTAGRLNAEAQTTISNTTRDFYRRARTRGIDGFAITGREMPGDDAPAPPADRRSTDRRSGDRRGAGAPAPAAAPSADGWGIKPVGQ